MGQRIHQPPQTKARKSVTATAFSSCDVFDTWAQVYDEQPNPILTLEQRFLSQMLPDINGLHVLDAGCGTGRWLQFLAPRGAASLIGVDSSEKMLHRAGEKIGTNCSLRLGTCTALPISNNRIDLVMSSFVLSYLENLKDYALELHRITRPGAHVFLTDMHPDTAISCNWTRSFTHDGSTEQLRVHGHSLQEIVSTFKACGFELLANIQPAFDLEEKKIFEENGRLASYEESANLPAVYILQLQKKTLASKIPETSEGSQTLHLSGGRYALGPRLATDASIVIERGHIRSVLAKSHTDRK